MAAGRVSDWASLPRDLLDSILDRMFEFSDFIRFGCVCKPWRSIALETHSHRNNRSFTPMLMTPTKDNSINHRSLYSITEGAVCQIQMPIPCSRRFLGSSQGWLFMVDKSMNITLINPFLNKTVALPKFKVPTTEYWFQYTKNDNHDYFIRKAILLPGTCQNQGGENFEVLLIHGAMGELAHLKSREAPWKSVKVEAPPNISVFSDVISYKGHVLGVSYRGALVSIDVRTGACKIVIGATDVCANLTYLVESQDGDLLLVKRFLDWLDDDCRLHATIQFEVYKFLCEEQGPCWVGIERIGEQALFLGDSCSMSVSTRDFTRCKPNCVYYVDHYADVFWKYTPRSDEDGGIYNMEDKSFSRHYIPPDPSNCPTLPSIWIVPNLQNVNCASLYLKCAKID